MNKQNTIREFCEFMKKDYPKCPLTYCLNEEQFTYGFTQVMFVAFSKGKEAGQKLVITKSVSGERFDPHAR
jgi:hypothetical protein